MSAKDDALTIAQTLADLEVEYDIPMDNPLHDALVTGLNNNADLLGLSQEDIDEIMAVGPNTPNKPGAAHPRGGGTGKDPGHS